MARFEARTSVGTSGISVALVGDCDLAAREELTSVLLAAVDRADVVSVDLAEVGFLDSSGLHALIQGHHAAIGRGGRLCVVNATGVVAQVLELTGVGQLLGPPHADATPVTSDVTGSAPAGEAGHV